MNKIRNSWAIMMSSLELMGEHKKLAWFPLINFIALIGILLFFAMPLMTDMTVFNLSETLPLFLENMEDASGRYQGRGWYADAETRNSGFSGEMTPGFILVYLVSMILTTFVNVAFYHEILKAFNGEKVSLDRGFSFAKTKWKAILAWSFLAGIIGVVIRQIEENVGFVGRWITGLIGIAWSVASVFAIPVMIREEQQNNPVDYLKKSAALISKTWGEGITGIASITIVVVMMIMATISISIVLAIIITPLILLLVLPIILLLIYISGIARNVYLCGLYVYASEGVVPGHFSAEAFDHAWKVKKKKK